MKTKLTLSVNRATLLKARRMLQRRGRSISAEVDALLERIANEKLEARPLWSERFGDVSIPIDLREAESDSWYGKHLRKTAAYREAQAAQSGKRRRQ
jgi:hypothetical protein